MDVCGHMEKTYVIAWKSKSGPSIGRGTKFFTREEAEDLAIELNEDHPNFIHEPLNLNPSATAIAEPATSPILAFPVAA